MVDVSFFQVGNEYEFDYPRYNFYGVQSKLVRRRIRVTAIRDLWGSPLDPETVELQPILRRGRWLIVGEDLDKNAERSFYLKSIDKAEALAHAA